jgi:hypothetical protein
MSEDTNQYEGWPMGDLLETLTGTKKDLKKANDEVTRLNKQKDALEQAIIKAMQEMGLTQIKNEYGTISITETIYAQIEDLDVFYEHIMSTEQPWLLQKRPNVTAYRELLAQGEQVPGLKPFTKRTLTVRK